MAQVTVPPAVLPVETDDVKSHLRIDTNADDALIAAYIGAATTRGENITGRAFITQTLVERFKGACGEVELSRWPVQLVSEITVGGVPFEDFDFESDAGDNAFVSGLPKGDVVVTYKAGYGDAGDVVPEPIKLWIMAAVGAFYENREAEIADSRAATVVLSYLDCLLDGYRIWRA